MRLHTKHVALLVIILTICAMAQGQVAYQLSPVPHQQFLDSNGKPLAGGLVYTYNSGSTTPLATYKDNAGTANTNPIVLDAGGFATIYLGQNSYKFVVQNSSAVQQWSQDNVQNISQVLLTTANTWTLGQTFNALISFLGGTSDTTAADSNWFYRTDLHRYRWYDAGSASWHSVTGDDDTATLTNKTYDTAGSGNVFKMAGTTVSGVTGSGSGVLATSPTITTPTLTGPKVDRLFSSGSAPGIAVTGFGASPTVTVEAGSTDSLGSVLVTAGTTPAATGTVVLTLSASVAMGPACVWQLASGSGAWTAGATWLTTAISTTATTLTWTNGASTNLVNASSYRAVWVCGLK